VPADRIHTSEAVIIRNTTILGKKREQAGFAKVTLGGAEVSIGRTFSTTFALVY